MHCIGFSLLLGDKIQVNRDQSFVEEVAFSRDLEGGGEFEGGR